MKNLLAVLKVSLLFLPILFVYSCNDDEPMDNDPQNISEIVADTDRFSTLLAALQRADLVTTLESGNYTVFAPNNDAFDAFLNGATIESIDIATLTQVLLYHVIGDEVTSGELTAGYKAVAATEATTNNPLSLLVNLDNGVTLNGSASVIAADIQASNGVIHEINTVLAPPTVVDLAIKGGFDSLVVALSRQDLSTDLVAALSGTGPFTVFAPTNAAFEALINAQASWNSIADIDAATLEAVLTYHVVPNANVLSSTLTDGQSVTSLEGSAFTINIGSNVTITDANANTVDIVATDVQGKNGVVHVINGVILP